MKTSALEETQSLQITKQIYNTLIKTHNTNIIHHNLKPNNVMLTNQHKNQNYIKILNFNITKILHNNNPQNTTITQTNIITKTPQYISPKQTRNKKINPQSNLYTIKLILYKIITTTPPLQNSTSIKYLLLHTTQNPQSPSKKIPELQIQPHTKKLIIQYLQKNPTNHFQSTTKLHHKIHKTLQNFPSSIKKFPTPSPQTNIHKNTTPTTNNKKKILPFIINKLLL